MMQGYIQKEAGSSEWYFGLFSEFEAPEASTGQMMTWADFGRYIRDTRKDALGTPEEIEKKAAELGNNVKRFQEPGESGRICFGVMEADIFKSGSAV
jgi:hypothetical protein